MVYVRMRSQDLTKTLFSTNHFLKLFSITLTKNMDTYFLNLPTCWVLKKRRTWSSLLQIGDLSAVNVLLDILRVNTCTRHEQEMSSRVQKLWEGKIRLGGKVKSTWTGLGLETAFPTFQQIMPADRRMSWQKKTWDQLR